MACCTLCTIDVIRGTMYRIQGGYRSICQGVVCESCRAAVLSGRAEQINEPLCECGKFPEWACKARLDKENCPNHVA